MKDRFPIYILLMAVLVTTHAQQPQNDPNWQTVFEDNFSSFDDNRWYSYPDSLYANVHWDFTYPFEGDHHSPYVHQMDPTNYHWYGIEWDSLYVRWYYDRELFHMERNNWGGEGIQHGMHLILC